MKYANTLILLLLLALTFFFKEHIRLSTNLLSLFASKEAIEKLDIANNLGYSKEMFIALKGFDANAKKQINEIAAKLETMPAIKSVHASLLPSEALQAYYKKYYPLLCTFDETNQTQESVHKTLATLYSDQLTNIFYTPADKNDPLKLFHMPSSQSENLSHKGGLMTIENYGYLLRASTDVAPAQMAEAKALYKEIQEMMRAYPEAIAFAPFFYTVENSEKIQSDVERILALSTIVLLLIYFLMIKNIKLLSHTLIALFSSMIFAMLLSTLFFEDFHILSLAFGMSITAVSIDYLLHYHFHNFYGSQKRIDRNVLYGFLTTAAAFGIFSFIPIPLISQISFFAVLSLFFAYMLFTFVFPLLQIEAYKADATTIERTNHAKKIPAAAVFLLCILLLSYSATNLQLDSNIRNLDYQNSKLKSVEEIFKSANTQRYKPIIVQAPTKEALIKNLHLLHETAPKSFSFASFVLDSLACEERRERILRYDFEELAMHINKEAEQIGFRKNYFQEAYNFTKNLPSCAIPDLEVFKTYGLTLYAHNTTFYTLALVPEEQNIKEFAFATDIDVKQMFEKVAAEMHESLLLFSLFVLGSIVILLALSVKKRFLYALNYILFPSSLVLAVLVSFTPLNIMHIFSLIILIAIGIDYGIYMSNSEKKSNTVLAIKYSLLSTFAAFGVLVFSSITALNSIGLVITLGLLGIFLLIKGMK